MSRAWTCPVGVTWFDHTEMRFEQHGDVGPVRVVDGDGERRVGRCYSIHRGSGRLVVLCVVRLGELACAVSVTIEQPAEVGEIGGGAEVHERASAGHEEPGCLDDEALQGAVVLVGDGPLGEISWREPSEGRVEHDQLEGAVDAVVEVTGVEVDRVRNVVSLGVARTTMTAVG